VKLTATDVIAIVAIFIAISTTVIQIIYERKREWHNASELLIKSITSIYEDVNLLLEKPHQANHITYQFCLKHRLLLLEHYRQRFFLKHKRITNAQKIIVDRLMELPLKLKYEEIIIRGNKNKTNTYLEILNEIRVSTVAASESLIQK